jgi:hypothetical protein
MCLITPRPGLKTLSYIFSDNINGLNSSNIQFGNGENLTGKTGVYYGCGYTPEGI